MAQKQIDPLAATASAAAPDAATEELAALSPDLTVELAGRELTVREYRVFEGLEIAAVAAGFIADVVDVCREGEFTYQRVRPLFGRHLDVVADLVSRSVRDTATGEPVSADWIRSLQRREDLETLLSVWFGVNSGFFVHEAIVVMRQEQLRAVMDRGGSTSSPDSPKAASAPTTASGN